MTTVKSAIEAESPKCESHQCNGVQVPLLFFSFFYFKEDSRCQRDLCFLIILILSFLEIVLKGRLEGNSLELKLGIMLGPGCCVSFADCRNVNNASVCPDNCQEQR